MVAGKHLERFLPGCGSPFCDDLGGDDEGTGLRSRDILSKKSAPVFAGHPDLVSIVLGV